MATVALERAPAFYCFNANHVQISLLKREDPAEVREMVRGLVETIVLVPEGERLRVLGLVERARNAKGIADAGAVAEQI